MEDIGGKIITAIVTVIGTLLALYFPYAKHKDKVKAIQTVDLEKLKIDIENDLWQRCQEEMSRAYEARDEAYKTIDEQRKYIKELKKYNKELKGELDDCRSRH